MIYIKNIDIYISTVLLALLRLSTIAIQTSGNAYKALTHHYLGKSDHDSILLLPSYRQKLKQEVPMLRTIQCWSDQSE
jgi:hypothetical protein